MLTQALVVLEPNEQFGLQDIELDELQGDEVLVEMVATGICHTDLKSAAGGSIVKFPVVLGHEGILLEQSVDCRRGGSQKDWYKSEKSGRRR